MQIVFLGTGGYHPNERRHTAGVLVPELGLLFDAGSGLFRLSGRLSGGDLTVVLSHAHLDHVCGLTYLLVPLHRGEIRRLRVYGTGRTLDAVRSHLFAEPLFPVLPECEFLPLEETRQIELSGGSVTHLPLPSHPGHSTGFRLEWPAGDGRGTRSLAYITDTCVDGSYTEFIRGVDLLIHECYFPDGQAEWARRTGHSQSSAVATLAREAGVGRLLLTHIDPQRPDDDPVGLEGIQAIFPASELAEDLLTIDV